MDENTARLAEQLRRNPAMLKSLMQRAVQSAARGDTSAMVQMVNQIMQTPSGAELVERINKAVQR